MELPLRALGATASASFPYLLFTPQSYEIKSAVYECFAFFFIHDVIFFDLLNDTHNIMTLVTHTHPLAGDRDWVGTQQASNLWQSREAKHSALFGKRQAGKDRVCHECHVS